VRITEVETLKLRYVMDVAMADAGPLHAGAHPAPGPGPHRRRPRRLGECAAYGGTLDSMEAVVLGDLRPSLVGEDPFTVERLWSKMAWRSHQRGHRGMLPMAISGVDTALWDIIGQATKTPLYRLLGGYRDTLDAYASAGFYAGNKGFAEVAEEFAGYAAAASGSAR
jgi:L-alanine-DL-glutamate epimerase-like enolase superfamily enzyme